MTWQLVYSISSSDLFGKVLAIPYAFNDSLIVVEAICNARKPKWFEAGWLKQVKDIPNIGTTKQHLKKIYLERQEVKFEPKATPLPYTLEFISREWIPDITLKFWQNDRPLFPVVQSPDNSNQPNQVEIYNGSVTSSVTRILDTNPNRRRFSIVNTSNNSLYLDFVSSFTSSSALIAVNKGETYVDDFNWSGEVYAVAANDKTVSYSLREYVYEEL